MQVKTFRIDDVLEHTLLRFCNENSLTDGYLIREAIADYLKHHWNLADEPLILQDQPKPSKRVSKRGIKGCPFQALQSQNRNTG